MKLDSAPQKEQLQLLIIGSPDFARRMSAVVRRDDRPADDVAISVSVTRPSEARAQILSERPDCILVDIGLATTKRDVTWLRTFLTQIRERFESQLYVMLAVTTPEKFVYGGELLFSKGSLDPSGLIDNLLVIPPPAVPTVPGLETQLLDCLTYVTEEMKRRNSGGVPLPALWSDGWVPVMCDPESRNVWMRWLPRYARYINENPLIVGPTGSGKTRLAAAIHNLSRREGPFVSITPRDFSSNELVQAELFGAVAGAYTGAVEKWGLVKKAERGTLFIDELQSIDLDLQGKLITFIENKTYRRVGEADSHFADVRFIFATNRPLQDLVKEGKLRDDFAYRLERLQISLSPLHHRRLDIGAAICFSLAKVLRERSAAQDASGGLLSTSQTIEGLTPGAYQMLFSASWPGNLRQLENTVAKLIELADIKRLTLIDNECTGGAIQSLLGRVETSSSDIYERAAIDVAIIAAQKGFENLSACITKFTDCARNLALELTGGDVPRAAVMIGDSERRLNLYSSSRDRSR